MTKTTNLKWDDVISSHGMEIQKDVPLANYTAVRVGGSADALIVVKSFGQFERVIKILWEYDIPFIILGGGSNVLISDEGIREVVILNKASNIVINNEEEFVWATSGASFGQMARKVSAKGYGGLEWATGIPGTVGGAIYGNAGAHGGDVATSLKMAEILHKNLGKENWTVEQLDFSYRSSKLKRETRNSIILSASFFIEESSTEITKNLVEKFAAQRKVNQPPGASLGSMFKNPPGDFAGRLIESAGMKGSRVGNAMVSPVHANFIISDENTKAREILELVHLIKRKVFKEFNISLELEIELLGDWA